MNRKEKLAQTTIKINWPNRSNESIILRWRGRETLAETVTATESEKKKKAPQVQFKLRLKKKLEFFFIKLWASGESRKKYFYVYISAVSVIYSVASIGCRPNGWLHTYVLNVPSLVKASAIFLTPKPMKKTPQCSLSHTLSSGQKVWHDGFLLHSMSILQLTVSDRT